jgi:multidrug transporter EmrE-like cation transporter
MFNYIFLLGSVVSNVIGQTFMKAGANQIGGLTVNSIQDIFRIFFSPFIFLGIATYGVSTIFWIITLSKFDLSYAYPFLSVGYILILFVSFFIFHESITVFKIMGIFAIVAGLILISLK